jgi:small subunit ribosomal protein S1
MVQNLSGNGDANSSQIDDEMTKLFEEEIAKMPSLRRGEAIEGKVLLIDEEGVLVNIGAKSEGMIPHREIRTLGDDNVEALKAGDPIITVMIRQDENGQYVLSYDRAQAERGWRELEKEMEAGNSVTAKVTGFNRGGLLVDALGVGGFVPLSQLSQEHRSKMQQGGEEEIAAVLETMIGEDLTLKIIEVNRRRQRAILSERGNNQEERDEKRLEIMSELVEGSIMKGKITGVREFGAFVDLGGVDGLIHISELSWQPVVTPTDIVQPGQELEVYILKVDLEAQRISLSLRRSQPDPWQIEIAEFAEGQIVEAAITRLTPFGAFAKIGPNIEGLIHVSELSENHVRHPKEIVKEDEKYTVKILRIEPERRRLGLSIRQVDPAEQINQIDESKLIHEPEPVVNEPEPVVNEPEPVVNEQENVVNEPEPVVNEQENVDLPDNTVDEIPTDDQAVSESAEGAQGVESLVEEETSSTVNEQDDKSNEDPSEGEDSK